MQIVFYGRTTTRSSLASQTLYLTVGGRKGSGVRLYVSCPSPGIVGKRILLPYCLCWLWFANVLEITARISILFSSVQLAGDCTVP